MDTYIDEENRATEAKHKNASLFRGLRRQTVQAFVEYLKSSAPGTVLPEGTGILLKGISSAELDELAAQFLDT